MIKLIHFIVRPFACLCLSACTTISSSPIQNIGVTRPGAAKIVVVCPARGLGAKIIIDDHMEEVVPGGHIIFDVDPGKHTVSLNVPHYLLSPGVHSRSFSVAENEVLFFSLDPTGPLETARMNSPAGYSSDFVPLNTPGPIGISLVPVSREKASKIALF